jgi:hypothetical protein
MIVKLLCIAEVFVEEDDEAIDEASLLLAYVSRDPSHNITFSRTTVRHLSEDLAVNGAEIVPVPIKA